ncbi:hypothetical protein ACHWQZ_G018100 [Mnemiopsis leidyi]
MPTKSRALRKRINQIMEDLRSKDPRRLFRGTSKVSKILRAPAKELEWDSDQVIDAVVKAGAVPLLASFLTHIEDQKLQSEAANALANISAGSADNTRAVIDAGVVPIATLLLESPSIDLQDHAAWLLANIACENCSCVLHAGALAPLLRLLDSLCESTKSNNTSEQSLIKTATWLLSNLCQYTDSFEIVKECLPRLAKLIKSNNEAVLRDACWGVMYMCKLSIQEVLDSGACDTLVKLLMHSSDDVTCVALEALLAIFTNGNLEQKKYAAITCRALPRLRFLLHNKRERTREIACQALSHIAIGSVELVKGLHDAQVYPCLVHLCMRQSHSRGSWLTWKEAVKTLSNTLTTSMFNRQIIKYLVGLGAVTAIVDSLVEIVRNQASIHLCFDVALQFIELLVTAGAKDAEERGDGVNDYREFLEDTGVPEIIAVAALDRVCRDGIGSGSESSTEIGPIANESAHQAARVASLFTYSSPEGCYVPTLKRLCRRKVFQSEWKEVAQFALSCPLRCFMVGLRAEDSELVTGILLCTVKEALSVKYTGDNAFFSGRYQEAAKRYSEALQLIESLDSESFEQLTLTVLLNRTGCNMKLSMWPDVIQDCIRGLAIHPKHPKFLQMRASAYEKLGMYQNALDDYNLVKTEESEAARIKLKERMDSQQLLATQQQLLNNQQLLNSQQILNNAQLLSSQQFTAAQQLAATQQLFSAQTAAAASCSAMFNTPSTGAGIMPNTSQLLANHQLLLSQQQLANLNLLDHQQLNSTVQQQLTATTQHVISTTQVTTTSTTVSEQHIDPASVAAVITQQQQSQQQIIQQHVQHHQVTTTKSQEVATPAAQPPQQQQVVQQQQQAAPPQPAAQQQQHSRHHKHEQHGSKQHKQSSCMHNTSQHITNILNCAQQHQAVSSATTTTHHIMNEEELLKASNLDLSHHHLVHETLAGEFGAPPTSPVNMPDTFELEEEIHLPGPLPAPPYIRAPSRQQLATFQFIMNTYIRGEDPTRRRKRVERPKQVET